MKSTKNTIAYANYKDFEVLYDTGNHTFNIRWRPMGMIMTSAGIQNINCHGERFDLNDFARVTWETVPYSNIDGDGVELHIHYEGIHILIQKELDLIFLLSRDTVYFNHTGRGDMDVYIGGFLQWGNCPETDTFAVNLNRSGADLRAALGPAASSVDNALFDRKTDSVLEILGCRKLQLRFDWEREEYAFTLNTEGNDISRGFRLKVYRDIYEKRFPIQYKPYNKDCTFSTPPAGWMTWYAVKFGACEEKVLENARWVADNLKKYGANCIWVDWEWYHQDMSGHHNEGVDVFHPDPERYPNGMAYVAKVIRKLGLIPALWIGATNDVNETKFMKENPGVVLCVKPSWCGSYFLDPTHPKVMNEYIPKVFNQLREWGYEALKWDCLPISIQYYDSLHEQFYNPEQSTEKAFLDIIRKARDTVGENYYMLSCSGHEFRDISMAMDIFDAMRIGGDIFEWDKFVSQCVARVMKYYVYHNVVCLNDPDNVVLRPEFNTYDQAVSRASFVGLLGLPLTYGDDLPALPEDRVELLRRITPPLDIHPADIRENSFDGKLVKIVLTINKRYEQWTVIGVFNLLNEPVQIEIGLRDDLHLDTGEGMEYLVFDYWNRKYLGSFHENLLVTLEAYACRVLAVRRLLPRPQVVSTTRHISQGALDILSIEWDDESNKLFGESSIVENEPYEMFIRMPEGYEIKQDDSNYISFEHRELDLFRVVFSGGDEKKINWQLGFTKMSFN